jgi:hypothetical protein
LVTVLTEERLPRAQLVKDLHESRAVTNTGWGSRTIVRDHDVQHPAAECVRRNAINREATKVVQTRGVRYRLPLRTGIRLGCNKPVASS